MINDFWKEQREKSSIDTATGLKIFRHETVAKKPAVTMFKPKAFKPFVKYYFSSIEDREKYINDIIDKFKSWNKLKEDRKKARKLTQENIDSVHVGTIFHYSWGYEQTNCQFYQVIYKKGALLKLKEINSQSTSTETGNSMSDFRIAIKDSFINDSDILTKRLMVSDNQLYISMPYGYCSLWDGKAKYNSWYA